MGDVTIRLVVDEPKGPAGAPAALASGATVRGRMRVETARPVRANGFLVSLEWRTDGPGNKDTAVVQKAAFPPEELAPGGGREVPFSFTVPADGPVSYEGKYVKVIWEIVGTADIPWAIDPRERLKLWVGPRQE